MQKSVIFFKSKSCSICKMIEPAYSAVHEKFKDTVATETVDITENIDKAVELGVMSVPTIIFLKDNKEVERLTGMVQPGKIEQAFTTL